MSAARVLVADASDLFRAGARRLLHREGSFDVAEARDLGELMALVAGRSFPDLALVDLDLPPAGAPAAIAELRSRCSCRIVVWSFEPAGETILEAIRAGASGYLEKTVAPEGLVRALRASLRDEAALPRPLTARLIEAVHAHDERVRARRRAAALSAREREVLDLIAAGAPNHQIAEQLLISQFTVKRHLQNILRKLELRSRSEAAALWDVAVAGEGAAELAGAEAR